MALKIASRAAIPPFIAMEVLRAANARAASGGAVFHLELGQPDTPAPAAVIEAAKRALDSNRLGYTEALGIGPGGAQVGSRREGGTHRRDGNHPA